MWSLLLYLSSSFRLWSSSQCLYQYELYPELVLVCSAAQQLKLYSLHILHWAGVKIGHGVFVKYEVIQDILADWPFN